MSGSSGREQARLQGPAFRPDGDRRRYPARTAVGYALQWAKHPRLGRRVLDLVHQGPDRIADRLLRDLPDRLASPQHKISRHYSRSYRRPEDYTPHRRLLRFAVCSDTSVCRMRVGPNTLCRGELEDFFSVAMREQLVVFCVQDLPGEIKKLPPARVRAEGVVHRKEDALDPDDLECALEGR